MFLKCDVFDAGIWQVMGLTFLFLYFESYLGDLPLLKVCLRSSLAFCSSSSLA